MNEQSQQVEVSSDVQEMISKFQCPGCTCGTAPCNKCESYKPCGGLSWECENHSAGTMITHIGRIFLGLPRGFNHVGACEQGLHKYKIIRLWRVGTSPAWDYLNIPVWAMEQDGYLFVRTYCPRLNHGFVDIIEGGSLELMPPETLNVMDFIGEID